MVEFYISVWFFALQYADGRVHRYKYEYSDRFKTELECVAFNKTLFNHFPKENQIDDRGNELRYADYYCVEVKRPGSSAWASQPRKHPSPPRRPSDL